MKRWMVPLSCIWLGGVAAAQTPPDTVHVSAQADAVESARGGSLGLTWVNPISERTGVDVGAASGAIGNARWAYGRLGGFLVRRGVGLSTAVDAGGGMADRRGFGYQRVRGEVTFPLAAGRVRMETEGQLSRTGSDVTTTIRAGASWRVSSATTLQTSYYSVSASDVTTPMVSAKVDVDRHKVGLVGGLVLTRQHVVAPLARQIGASPWASNQFFAGCRFPVRSYRMLLVLDVSTGPQPAVRVLSSLRIPLRATPPTTPLRQPIADDEHGANGR